MKRNILKLLTLLLFLLPHFESRAELELPELGDSSANTLTPEQEQQIGAEVLRRMRHAGVVIEDPLINSYIEDLGAALAVQVQSEHEFTFFVVDAPSINAFALPGGYIGIHSGLLLASSNESELASVIAHEIAHISQHHLARGVEQANRMNLPLSVALIAAILLSGNDPNVANAVMAASLGGSAQMQLNFTRAHEHEADRVGMQLLAESEFDPRGMADFFARLQEASRYHGEGVPEFLSTHPVTSARLAEAQSTASQYPRKMRVDTLTYQVARARVQLHHAKSATTLLKELQEPTGSSAERKEATSSDTYLRAIALIQLQQPNEATVLLQHLLVAHPNSIALRETLGQLHLAQGQYGKAINLYRDGLRLYPSNELLNLSMVDALLAQRSYAEARERLQGLLRLHPESAPAFHRLARLETLNGNSAASHLARAEYYLLLLEPHSALEQLNLAKQGKDADFYLTSRIDALNTKIKQELESTSSIPFN